MPVDLAKRLFELEAQVDRKEDENRRLLARNLQVEEKNREQRRSLEEKREQIIRLYEDVTSLKGSEGRWKEKYESLYEKCQRDREEYELGEVRWKEKVKNIEEKCWKLEVEKRKLEIDLEAARGRADEIGEAAEKMKAAEELGSLLEEKDVVISELQKRIGEFEREKMKMEKELGDRVVKLEEGVAKWVRMSSDKAGKQKKSAGAAGIAMDDLGHNVQGPKSTGISVLDLEKENLEADVPLTCAPKPIDYHIVQISDDEDEEKGLGKQIPASFASPSVAKCPQTKRKSIASTCSAEKQAESKRCKSNGLKDGTLWKTAIEMQKAFETDQVLCMKSVCALYRKHKSLGVWKYCLDGNKAFAGGLEIRGVALGMCLTSGDPEGRMNKSSADLEREDSRGIKDCSYIAKYHHKELFEIYKDNLDPFFLP